MSKVKSAEHPILFSAAMVRAILSGEKTQTRRVVKPQPCEIYEGAPYRHTPENDTSHDKEFHLIKCPYGYPEWDEGPEIKDADRLWVRETWAAVPCSAGCEKYPDGFNPKKSSHSQPGAPDEGWRYKATWDRSHGRWYPSIHMRREASRITLEIVSLRVELLNEISEADALAEGVKPFIPVPGDGEPETAKQAFQRLWDSINGKRPGAAWNDAPYVWVVEFKRIDA